LSGIGITGVVGGVAPAEPVVDGVREPESWLWILPNCAIVAGLGGLWPMPGSLPISNPPGLVVVFPLPLLRLPDGGVVPPVVDAVVGGVGPVEDASPPVLFSPSPVLPGGGVVCAVSPDDGGVAGSPLPLFPPLLAVVSPLGGVSPPGGVSPAGGVVGPVEVVVAPPGVDPVLGGVLPPPVGGVAGGVVPAVAGPVGGVAGGCAGGTAGVGGAGGVAGWLP
jgi:hypothetical protein